MRKPFFKKSHQAWYVHHPGQMHRLGPDKEAAFQKYHELLASQAPVGSSDSVATLLNSFLAWCQKHRSERTYTWYKDFLSSFARSIGVRQRIGALQPLHVTKWLEGQAWNETTRYNAVRAVKRAFNWAVKEGRLAASPLRNVERPTPNRREAFVDRQQFDALIERASDQCFRDYLTFLFETGARPQEIKVIEARHCDLAARRVILPTQRAKGKKFPRVIYFTAAIEPMIARLCQQHPQGALFRNADGEPWKKDSVNCRLRRIRTKLEKAECSIEGLCATALRHGFATEALKRGVDPITVSILMGHSDASQVARTYQHLAADAGFLAQSLEKARGQGG